MNREGAKEFKALSPWWFKKNEKEKNGFNGFSRIRAPRFTKFIQENEVGRFIFYL
jgi:hypothetical protein